MVKIIAVKRGQEVLRLVQDFLSVALHFFWSVVHWRKGGLGHQSVQRLTTGWTVRGSNPGRCEIFPHQTRLSVVPNHFPRSLFPGGKAAGAWL